MERGLRGKGGSLGQSRGPGKSSPKSHSCVNSWRGSRKSPRQRVGKGTLEKGNGITQVKAQHSVVPVSQHPPCQQQPVGWGPGHRKWSVEQLELQPLLQVLVTLRPGQGREAQGQDPPGVDGQEVGVHPSCPGSSTSTPAWQIHFLALTQDT